VSWITLDSFEKVQFAFRCFFPPLLHVLVKRGTNSKFFQARPQWYEPEIARDRRPSDRNRDLDPAGWPAKLLDVQDRLPGRHISLRLCSSDASCLVGEAEGKAD
jgi:hypothetical protein